MTAPTNRRWASSVPIQIHQPPPPRQALRIPARIPAAAVRVPSSSSASVNLTYSSANALSLEDDPLAFIIVLCPSEFRGISVISFTHKISTLNLSSLPSFFQAFELPRPVPSIFGNSDVFITVFGVNIILGGHQWTLFPGVAICGNTRDIQNHLNIGTIINGPYSRYYPTVPSVIVTGALDPITGVSVSTVQELNSNCRNGWYSVPPKADWPGLLVDGRKLALKFRDTIAPISCLFPNLRLH